MNQAGPIVAVFTAAVLGGAGVGTSFLGAENQSGALLRTPSRKQCLTGARAAARTLWGGLEQLASAAAEMPRCTFPEG